VTPSAPPDFERYRDEFPVVGPKAYLISASLGPLSNRARRSVEGYLDAWARKGAPGPVGLEDTLPAMGTLT